MRDRNCLIQEDYRRTSHFPWKVLVICQCLNRATWPVAEVVVQELFDLYPSPYECDEVDLDPESESHKELYEIVKALGLGHIRAKYLVNMSRQYTRCYDIFKESYYLYKVKEFMGCGKYACDAWALFVLRDPCDPQDRLLKKYAERVGLFKNAPREQTASAG